MLVIIMIISLCIIIATMGQQGEPEPSVPRGEAGAPTITPPAHRPTSLAEYVGQEEVKETLGFAIRAHQRAGTPLPHVLLTGPAGLGKTSLANVIATEFGTALHTTSGVALRDMDDLYHLCEQISSEDIVFIDEIHAIAKKDVQEALLTALEDRAVTFALRGEQPFRIPLPPFTLVGATTDPDRLHSAVRSRFALAFHLDYYTEAQLFIIVNGMAQKQAYALFPAAAKEIARRARGTPRVARHLLDRAWHIAYADVKPITTETVLHAARLAGIDHTGLTKLDLHILRKLAEMEKPVGVGALAASLGQLEGTIKTVHEPFLLHRGLVARSSRGRALTDAGKAYLEG